MKKKILILSTSPRSAGNSDRLADAFLAGARAAGHETEKISLRDKNIGFYKGCMACQKTGRCVIHDDMQPILQKMLTADVLVFATPIYYYEMCGQMKTLLDRSNPLYNADYAFRDIYLLATAADEARSAAEGAQTGLSGWIVCFPEARFAGTVFGGGVEAPGQIEGHPALKEAYEAGKNA